MEQPISEYKTAFIARTKQAREKAHVTQKQMGQALGGVAQDIYKNYETIRELPHEYIPTFCLVCGVTADWLFDVEAVAKRLNDIVESKPSAEKTLNPIPGVPAKVG